MYNKSLFADLNASIKKVQLEELAKGEVYPATIVKDRYNGCYSGAKWLAFNIDPSQIPDEIGSSDPDEMMFWRAHKQDELPIGKGETPQDALIDLHKRMIEYYEQW